MVQDYKAKHAHHVRNDGSELLQSLDIRGSSNSHFYHSHQNGTSAFVEELSRVLEFYNIDQLDLNDSHLVLSRQQQQRNRSMAPYGDKSTTSHDSQLLPGRGMAESKVQYVRQMVFQLLVCTEPEVKAHIEAALIALLRFTDEERQVIESRKRDEAQTPLSSIATLWESFTITST